MPHLANVIAILDDEPERTAAMLPRLTARFPQTRRVVFDNAPDMIAWLATHSDEMVLVSLDHDLGATRTRDGAPFDPGTGRDVADCLAQQSPKCPVIVHTTNYLAAPGMCRVLEETGWKVARIMPYGDLDWIHEIWIREVRRLLGTT